MLAENEIDSPELKFTPIDNPGYDIPEEWADRYYLWLDRWGVLPDELDRQDRRKVAAIELKAAMKSQVQREYLKEREEKNTGENDGSF